MRGLGTFAFAVLFCISGRAASAAPRDADSTGFAPQYKPTLAVGRSAGEITIDGQMQDAGWTIANHTYDHLNASSYLTASEVRTYMQNVVRNDKFLADNGFQKGRKHFAYPNGECTPGIHDVAIKESGKFLTARAINGAGRGVQHITGCNYPFTLPAYGVGSTTLLSDLTARLDNAGGTGATVASGRTTITYIHALSYSAGTIYLNPDVFRGYIDDIAARISTGNFVAHTIDQWAAYAGVE